MARHELTDAQFALIEPLLPTGPRRGRPWKDHRAVLNGLFWKLNTGVPWRDIPERYGAWQTIYDRYVFWRRDGTWERIMAALQVQLDGNDQLDWQQWNIDGTVIRASRAAAGAQKKGFDGDEPTDHALGRSCGGFGTKLHLLVDGRGIPLAATITAGQTHESTAFETVMNRVQIRQPVGRPRCRPDQLAGDRGYDARWIRQWLRTRGIRPIIPPRKRAGRQRPGRPVTYDRVAYRARNVVERCVGWLKECRSVATRFEKLALNYLGLVHVAIIQRYLRVLTASASMTT